MKRPSFPTARSGSNQNACYREVRRRRKRIPKPNPPKPNNVKVDGSGTAVTITLHCTSFTPM
jgi:hypothetical protein